MKTILLVIDGAADFPCESLDGQTPLQAAHTPHLDALARTGIVGSVQVTPVDMYPGSDAANMALLGYDPAKFYTGRGPIEAAAMQIPMEEKDVAFRCSLVTTDGVTMLDYSSGHIDTEDSRKLIELANSKLGTSSIKLFPGVSYRHIMRWTGGPTDVRTYPPHETVGRKLSEILPEGDGDVVLRKFIDDSINLLNDLPFNKRRREEGISPANTLWPWSPGRAPQLTAFSKKRGVTGGLISAVDVVRGLGVLTGLQIINVPGATGYFDTNYRGKAEYAVNALDHHDFVWIHVEAPDEAGHMGSVEEKVKAIENIDRHVVGTLRSLLDGKVDYRLLCAPDHMTPVSTTKHAIGPVPFLLYDSTRPLNRGHQLPYDERALDQTSTVVDEGYRLMDMLIEGQA